MPQTIRFIRFFVFVSLLAQQIGLADPQVRSDQVASSDAPEDYLNAGAESHGLGDAGIVAGPSLDSVRLNPGMLAAAKDYKLSGGYNWPVIGREFYHVGILDSQSSRISAAFQYTGFTERFAETKKWEGLDSPILKRLALAGAGIYGPLSVGLGAQYTEGVVLAEDGQSNRVIQGWTLGGGLVLPLSDTFRIGLSAENLGSRGLASFSPKIYRLGTSYLLAGGKASVHLDLRQREITPGLGASEALLTADGAASLKSRKGLPDERMLIVSGTSLIYDTMRLSVGYGRNLGGADREQFSTGLGFSNEKATLVFSMLKPRRESKEWSQAVSAAFAAKL